MKPAGHELTGPDPSQGEWQKLPTRSRKNCGAGAPRSRFSIESRIAPTLATRGEPLSGRAGELPGTSTRRSQRAHSAAYSRATSARSRGLPSGSRRLSQPVIAASASMASSC